MSITFPQFKMDREWLDAGEAESFRRMREHGVISFFRIALCEACGKEVPQGKRYCSKACFNIKRLFMEEIVNELMDQRILIETKDGTFREGSLTRINWSELDFNGVPLRWPKSLVLNAENMDEIDWGHIARIKVK